jgi:hypothetical protein
MKFPFRAKNMVLILISISTLIFPISTNAGGYHIVDRNGKDISEDSEKIINVSSSEKRVVFNDEGDRKVFDVEWDASNKILIIKGDNIYLQIYSTGEIKKFTTINENENEQKQMPITIQPVIPILPGQKPSTQSK